MTGERLRASCLSSPVNDGERNEAKAVGARVTLRNRARLRSEVEWRGLNRGSQALVAAAVIAVALGERVGTDAQE